MVILETDKQKSKKVTKAFLKLKMKFIQIYTGKRNYLAANNLAIYRPMIYTAPYVMLLMRADILRGQVGGGWSL